MKKTIVPSIIAKSQAELEERIGKVKKFAGLLQLDVMDGKFVPNTSLNFNFKLPKTKCRYEAHLMVKKPEKWIEKYWQKAGSIIFHIESCKKPDSLIKFVKSKKRKVGLALNPQTKAVVIKSYLNKIDKVLIMTVKPGFYGARFIPATLRKIRQLKKLKPKLAIEVDGSINPNTLKKASKAGADFFVVGSYLQNSKNVKKAIAQLKSGQREEFLYF